MALVLADRVRETSTTTGTGSVTLGGAYPGFQSFSAAVGNSNTTYYGISNLSTGEWEVGIGTYSTSGNTLSRTTVLASSNAGNLVVFTTGTKDVICTQPAERAVYLDTASNTTIPGITLSSGTANGVTYLNASKQLTSGTALTFDGANLGIGLASPSAKLDVLQEIRVSFANASAYRFRVTNTDGNPILAADGSGANMIFQTEAAERMRLTSTGLGIGTSSPQRKLGIGGTTNAYMNFNPSGARQYTVGSDASGFVIYDDTAGAYRLTISSTGAGTATQDWTFQGVTVGRGAGAVADNTAVGASALGANTSGSANSAFGGNTLLTNTSGVANTAVGKNSLYTNNGNYNVGVGKDALFSNTTASYNTAVGYQAGYTNTTGQYNTYLGYKAGNLATGSGNTIIGNNAGLALTTGSDNTFVGGTSVANSGGAITAGSKNTILGGYTGNQGGLDIRTANNYIVLSDGDGNPRVVVDGSGNMGVGTGAPTQKLTVAGNIVSLSTAGTDSFVNVATNGIQNTFLGFNNSGGNNTYGVRNNFSYIGNGNAYGLQFVANGGVVGTFDTSGNLGIATSSPDNKVTIRGGSINIFSTQNAADDYRFIGTQYDAGNTNNSAQIRFAIDGGDTKTRIAFATSNGAGSLSEKMLLDSAGNLGLGVTPSAWETTQNKALSVGYNANYYGGLSYNYGPNALSLATHAYNTTTAATTGWKYSGVSVYAGLYQFNGSNGQHVWYNAPSGNQGDPISFGDAKLTLDASGNLLVGTTSVTNSPTTGVQLANGGSGTIGGVFVGHASGTASGNYYATFAYAAGIIGSITQNGTTGVLYNINSDARLKTVKGAVSGHGERIDALLPVEYEWKADGTKARGFLAHQFQEVYPSSVTGSKDAVDDEGKPVYQAMQASTTEVIADLVAELQSLRARLAAAGL